MSKTYNICGGKQCCPKLKIEEYESGNTVSITDDYNGSVKMTKIQAKQLAETIIKEVD